MSNPPDIEDVIFNRQALLASARSARIMGLSAFQWIEEPSVRRLAEKYDLTRELEHMAAWVWTFQR